MPYIVDGHNLIGKLPGIRLADPDDERRLAEQLQAYAQQTHRALTVYFDKGQFGGQDIRAGRVTLKFVSGRTADQAIADHLRRLRGDARNWTVVSSDREVQAEARAAGAKVVSSESFAAMLCEKGDTEIAQREAPSLSEDEIAEWEAIFSRRGSGEPPEET
jgi:predicted RNA-binding protein with PIN domain